MTMSIADREASIQKALLFLVDKLDDRSVLEVFTDERTLDRNIKPTTWDALKQRGLVRQANRWVYTLSGSGWIEALKQRGELESDELRRMTGELCAALKGKIKGRAHEALANVKDLADEKGISEVFIRNAIESNLIGELFGITGADWDAEGRGKFVFIPRNFGHRVR